MKFKDFFFGFLHLSSCISIVSTLDTKINLLSTLSCAKLNSQIFNVSETNVKSDIDCARLYLESVSSYVMGIQHLDVGAVWCGLTTGIPTLSFCAVQDSDVLVYHSTGRIPACPVTCQTHLNLNNVTYCIHKTTDRTMNYTEAVTYCEQYGGQVAQAETLDDLDILGNAKMTTRCSWLAGNDYQVQGVYRWDRGDLVSSDLWGDGEPNSAHERCIAVKEKSLPCVFQLEDKQCWRQCYPLCAISCVEL